MLVSRRYAKAAFVAISLMLASDAGNEALSGQSGFAGEHPPRPAVDFAVVHDDGSPVGGLRESEVEIRIGGRTRKLLALRFIGTAPAPARAGTGTELPAPFGTNDTVAVGRSIAIVVDQESFAPGKEPLLRRAVEGLRPHLTPADRTMVALLPFGGVTVPFTSDTTRVRLAMDRLAGQGSRNESGSDLACRTRRFLDALDGFLRAQAGRSTPLTVVLFTAGLAAPRRDAPMTAGPGMCELLVNHYEQVTDAAAMSRAAVFVAVPDDLGTSGERWRESIGGVGFLGSNNPLEGIEHITGATGGVRLPLDASGTGALLRVANESAAYYVAELEPERDDASGRSRSLTVSVSRRDVTVRSRPSVTFARPTQRTPPPKLRLSELLLSREAATDLRLRAAGFTLREPGGRLRVGVVIEADEPGVSVASAGAILTDSVGGVAGRWFAADPSAPPILGAIVVPPGTYRLRVVAIDSAGRIGAAEDTVDASLTAAGPLSLGSLLIGTSRSGSGVEPRLQFGAEPAATASFDIYGGAAGMPISAAIELARSVDGPALGSFPIVLARAGESRVVATGTIPIGALPPGDYLVRGIIRLEDGTTARVTRTLRKIAR